MVSYQPGATPPPYKIQVSPVFLPVFRPITTLFLQVQSVVVNPFSMNLNEIWKSVHWSKKYRNDVLDCVFEAEDTATSTTPWGDQGGTTGAVDNVGPAASNSNQGGWGSDPAVAQIDNVGGWGNDVAPATNNYDQGGNNEGNAWGGWGGANQGKKRLIPSFDHYQSSL